MTTTAGTCKTCGGKGYLIRARQIGRRQFVREDETCPTCNGDGEGPDSPSAAIITVAGHTIHAPGFTPASFDRAIARAHDEGLTVDATDRRDMVLVTNPTHGTAYTVSRTSCSCTAGQHGIPCKHRALSIFLSDIMHQLPQPAIPAAAA